MKLKKFNQEIRKFNRYKSNKKYFLNKVIEVYTDFFKDIEIKKMIEHDGDGGYYLEIKIDVTDNLWELFESLSEKNDFQIDGTDTEFIIFED